MSSSVTHPLSAATAPTDVTVRDFKQRLKASCDYSAPSVRSKKYNRVRVLLLSWSTDDLQVQGEIQQLKASFELDYHYKCKAERIPAQGPVLPQHWLAQQFLNLAADTDEEDLLIVYYGGHGREGRYPNEGPSMISSGSWDVTQADGTTIQRQAELDFSMAKGMILDPSKADVLYLMDCCNATTAAIRPGKELIAACAVEEKTPDPGYWSFTAGLVQELNHAASSGWFLTAAQLWFKLLDQKHRSSLTKAPIHAEAMVGPRPRMSIFLAPLGMPGPGHESPYPLTGVYRTPVGSRITDVKVMLSVRLRDGTRNTVRDLTSWVTETLRPPGVAVGVSFEYAATSTSVLLVFAMPAPAYYCLESHPAIHFMGYVTLPEPEQPSTAQPALKENHEPRIYSHLL